MKSSVAPEFEVFPWNKNFETGHAVIDAQHRTLVDLLNELATTLIDGEYSSVNDAFSEMAAYAERHFNDEEQIWSRHFGGDAWYESHQMRHASFLPRVLELKDDDGDKPVSEVVESMIRFLIRWLAFHIIDDDKRMAFAVEAMTSGATVGEAKASADRAMSGSMRILIETVLQMYDGLSARTLGLLRERRARVKAEQDLRAANRKLQELSLTDQLSGLFNRRHLYSVFDNESRRARRDGTQLAFYLIDVDFFKRFNDGYGHLSGDKALRGVAECMQGLCRRPSDIAFRVGGEEFCILSAHGDSEDAAAFGERIRRSIEELKIPHAGNEVSEYVTVSIGVACRVPTGEDALDRFMSEADDRLYRAKSNGRNTVVVSD